MYPRDELTYRFADIVVDASQGSVFKDGEELHLRQKAFQVLVHLLRNSGRLVTKDELFENVWNSAFVTDDVLVQCVKEIRRALGDDPHVPKFIKTVPKAGYKFVGEIIDVPAVIDQPEPEVIETVSKNRRRRSLFAVIAVIGLVLTASIVYLTTSFRSRGADVQLPLIEGRRTIAVMFFNNQSKSAEFGWLREGLPDMLIAGLSRSKRLTILSREQLSTLLERYYDREVEITHELSIDLAKKSRAAYFVEGSFTQIGSVTRLDIRLFDTQSAELLATETLTVERPEQLLSQIDLISVKIASHLGGASDQERQVGQLMTSNLDAYRFYSLAVEKAEGLHNVEAIELLHKAIALDPEFAMAQARIGYTYAISIGDVDKGKPFLQKAFQVGSRLTEKDRLNISAWYAIANLDYPEAIRAYRAMIERFPLEAEAYSRLARLLRGEGQPDEAIDVLRNGLAIDPEAKDLYNALGTIMSVKGQHEEAIAAHERYVALAPNEPNALDSLGLSYQAAGNYQKAVETYEKAIFVDPKFEISIVHLANTRFQLGQYAAAIEAFQRYMRTAPSVNEKGRGLEGIAFVNFSWGRLQLAEKFVRERKSLQKDMSWLTTSLP